MFFLRFLLLILFINPVNLNNKWEFEFEKEGIKVYTQSVEGNSFKAFKGETVMEFPISRLVNFISNVELFPQWCYQTTSTEVLRKEENKVFYRYVSETPMMVNHREAYFCNEILTDTITGTVTILMRTFTNNTAVPKGFTRMPLSNGFWKLTPLGTTSTHITFQMHADPGGNIPAWLANRFSSDSPYITMKNLKKMMQNE